MTVACKFKLKWSFWLAKMNERRIVDQILASYTQYLFPFQLLFGVDLVTLEVKAIDF